MLQSNNLASFAVANSMAWVPLEMAVKGAAVLAVGAVCALLARGASAAVRHLIWTLSLSGAFVAPIAGALLPSWRIQMPSVEPPRWVSSAIARIPSYSVTESHTSTETHTVTESHSVTITRTDGDASAVASSWSADRGAGIVEVSSAEVPVAKAPAVEVPVIAVPDIAAPSVAEPPFVSQHESTASIGPFLIGLWLMGVIVVLVPTFVGMARVSALVRRARPMRGGRWALLAPSALREIDVRRRVQFLESDEPVMPMTSGLLRPVVLLPAGDFDSTIEQRLDVLRHELAHVRRYDCLTQLVAQLACAVNWFNPLAWLAARQMRIEREQACDDEVLRAGTKASEYADYLMRVARDTHMSAAVACGALAMARPSQLALRLRAVLEDGRRRERVSASLTSRAAIAAAGLVMVIGTATPVIADGRIVIEPPETMVIASAHAVPVVAAVPHDVPVPVEPANVAILAAPSLAGIAEAVAIPSVGELTAVEVAPTAIALMGAAECEREAARRGKSSHTNWTSNDEGSKRWRVRWSDGDCSFEVDARGEIRFNSDITDIESISRGGVFTLEQHIGDDDRRVSIRPRADGTLDRSYSINGDRREWDAAARRWFADALVMLERRTAFAVDQRVPVILQGGGVDAVLREISLMEGDYARRRYYTKLLSIRQLDATQVRRVVQQAGAEISSDYELAELLIAVSKLGAFDDQSHPEFVVAVKTIESDYERRRALNALLKRDRLAPETVEALLEAASTIRSDYELAELLIDVSKQYAVNDGTRPVYIKAVGSIESDYEQRRVLSTIVASGGLTAGVTRSLLESARSINSDYELAEFLIAISKKGVLDSSTSAAYFAAADQIRSDYEQRRALMPLIRRDLLTKELAKGILASALKLESDYECAELLVAFANAIAVDDELRPAFERAADTIQGEYEYGRAMSAIRRRVTR
jgi:beta-lactamase regulating signal transducer with metallopeptidase domain